MFQVLCETIFTLYFFVNSHNHSDFLTAAGIFTHDQDVSVCGEDLSENVGKDDLGISSDGGDNKSGVGREHYIIWLMQDAFLESSGMPRTSHQQS